MYIYQRIRQETVLSQLFKLEDTKKQSTCLTMQQEKIGRDTIEINSLIWIKIKPCKNIKTTCDVSNGLAFD